MNKNSFLSKFTILFLRNGNKFNGFVLNCFGFNIIIICTVFILKCCFHSLSNFFSWAGKHYRFSANLSSSDPKQDKMGREESS